MSSNPKATLVLGSDGMGENATDEDFDAWVQFVCDRIDERCGFEVDVDVCDGDDSVYVGDDEDAASVVRGAKAALWREWCAAGAPGTDR